MRSSALRKRPPHPAARDPRGEAWSAAPSIAERFPRAGRFAVELRFRDPAGVLRPSPYRQVFEPSMRAYFDQRCPLHDCSDGGFELQQPVSAALASGRAPRTGTASCRGTRQRGPCGLELAYTLIPERDGAV